MIRRSWVWFPARHPEFDGLQQQLPGAGMIRDWGSWDTYCKRGITSSGVFKRGKKAFSLHNLRYAFSNLSRPQLFLLSGFQLGLPSLEDLINQTRTKNLTQIPKQTMLQTVTNLSYVSMISIILELWFLWDERIRRKLMIEIVSKKKSERSFIFMRFHVNSGNIDFSMA